jgi:peptidyl-tRNA hydrolase
MYVVVNKDLKMSSGKVAAQVAHVSARLDMGYPKIVVVLQATTEQLHNLFDYIEYTPYCRELYIDEGVNEVAPMSATALAFGMVDEYDCPDFIKGFELYREDEDDSKSSIFKRFTSKR